MIKADTLLKMIQDAINSNNYALAVQLTQQLYVLYKETLGENHSDTLNTLDDLAGYYDELGDYNQAIHYSQHVYDISEQIFGLYHQDTLIRLNNLAAYYDHARDYHLAIELFLKAYNNEKEVLGKYHSYTLLTLRNLASSYAHIEDYQHAIEYGTEVYEARKEVLGEEHVDTLSSLDELAIYYDKKGDYSQAIELATDCYNREKKVLGDQHPDTLSTLNTLSILYYQSKEYYKALELKKYLYKIKKEGNYPDILLLIQDIASLYDQLGDCQKTLEFSCSAYNKLKEIYGDNHVDTIKTLRNLAAYYYKYNDFHKALELGISVYELRKTQLGMQHSDTLDALNDLTQYYDVLGNYDQAFEIAEYIYEKQKETLGENHPETLLSLSRLSIYYSRKGNFIAALKTSQIAYDRLNEVLGKTHLYTINTFEVIATNYYNLGDYTHALELEKEVYELRKGLLGDYDKKTIISLSNLSACYHRVKNYHQALTLGKSVYEKAKQKLGDSNPLTLLFLNNLAMQYSSIDNHDQAIELSTTAYHLQKEVLGEMNPITINTLSDLAHYYSEIRNDSKAIELGTLAYERSKEVLGESHSSTLKYLYRLLLFLYIFNGSHQSVRKYLMEYYKNIKDMKITAFNINDISSRRNYLEYFSGAYRVLKSCVFIYHFDELLNYLFINKNLFFEIDINRFNNNGLDDRTSLEEVTHTTGNNLIIDFYELENTGYGLILIKEGKYSQCVVDYEDIINGSFLNDEDIQSFIGSLEDYDHIYICPDGELYNLSFERILNCLDISYLSSVQTLFKKNEDNEYTNQLVSFVYPDFSGRQSEDNDRGNTKGVLYGSYLEGMFIHDIYGEKSTIYSSGQVKHDNFLNTKRPRILHVSTHGDYLGNENMEPMDRGILCLSGYNVEDNNFGYVSAKEIQYMDLKGTELVVLSACNTGLGENISGEGIYGIRRAFELAGCQTLLLTVEEVDDYNSAIFMKVFYERYNQTNNIYQSFKNTKEYLKEHGLKELKELRNVFEKEMKNKIKNPFIYLRNINELNTRISKSEERGTIVRKKNNQYIPENWNGFIIQGKIN